MHLNFSEHPWEESIRVAGIRDFWKEISSWHFPKAAKVSRRSELREDHIRAARTSDSDAAGSAMFYSGYVHPWLWIKN